MKAIGDNIYTTFDWSQLTNSLCWVVLSFANQPVDLRTLCLDHLTVACDSSRSLKDLKVFDKFQDIQKYNMLTVCIFFML